MNDKLTRLLNGAKIIVMFRWRRIRSAGHVTNTRALPYVHKSLFGKSWRKRLLGRPRCRRN